MGSFPAPGPGALSTHSGRALQTPANTCHSTGLHGMTQAPTLLRPERDPAAGQPFARRPGCAARCVQDVPPRSSVEGDAGAKTPS